MTSEPGQSQWFRFFLFATAFITGAVVMALEILGSRLLAPVFGNSLFVWGALIGVILGAMSSGYAFGGWLSDRRPGSIVLAGLLLFSGSWTLLLAWSGQWVAFQVLLKWSADPRWGSCLAASVLLAPPAFGLSAALPVLLRLAIEDLGFLGRRTGRMIAVSTVGSLVGTWGTAFFLLSWLGTKTLVAWLGGVQVLLGLVWFARTPLLRTRGIVPKLGGLALLGGLVVLGWLALHPVQVAPDPVYQEDSPYQQVRVRDTDLLRFLILDNTFHAVMWRADPVSLFLPYSQVMMAALALSPEPKRALILGHGGGSLAKWLGDRWPELELDTVELDPSVVRAAEQYFNYRPALRHHVHVKDARVFLRSTAATYDVIWVDVFARHLIPFHLTTTEFFSELRAHLNPDGILAVNLSSSAEGADRQRAYAVVQTLRTVFPVIRSFSVQGPWRPKQPGAANLIFFAGAPVERTTLEELESRTGLLVAANRIPSEAQALLIGTHRESPWPSGIVLTDDYAPFDLLMGRGVSEKDPLDPQRP